LTVFSAVPRLAAALIAADHDHGRLEVVCLDQRPTDKQRLCFFGLTSSEEAIPRMLPSSLRGAGLSYTPCHGNIRITLEVLS
jgi:hypothetical protein